MSESKQLEDFVSVREASELSGYTTEYIRNLIRSKAIKHQKIGYAVLVDRKSLEDYVKKTRVN